MANSVFVISSNTSFLTLIKTTIDKRFQVSIFEDKKSALSSIFDAFPDLIILEINLINDPLIRIINDIKSDSIFGQIGILCIVPDDFDFPSWDALLVDDYIRLSDVEKDLNLRIELFFQRRQRIMEVNPLTRLPGNISIQKQIDQRILKGEKFGIAYADIDYFKPYNDKYGFGRGDEVIRMLGRLIFNMVRLDQPQNSFIGHIGGDDFIYIMDIDLIEQTSQKIVEQFDKIIPIFYEQSDRERGFIESIDRSGKLMRFALMSLSVGITHNKYKKFQHYGQISEVLAEMKQHAKSIKGSYLIIDRRK